MKTQGREKDLKRWGRKQVYKDFYDQEIRKNTVNQYSALQVKNVKISYKKFGFVEWQRSILDHPYQNGVHDKPECYMDQKETNWVPLEEERHGPGRQ